MMLNRIKTIIISLLVMCATTVNAAAFSFPEPDWGALLKEKRAMINETNFELYTEGNPELAPYYGARLEPRSGVYFGMVTENSNAVAPVGSYLTYLSMSLHQTDIYYPANTMIREGNSVVTIGWTVDSIASIDYGVIRTALDTLAGFGKPMFIRFANEMNVSSLGDDPTAYVNAFRTVADMIHEYNNFSVVWSPNDLGALDRPFSYFYPGDEYVDWVGVSSYLKKYFQGKKNTLEKEAAYFMTGEYAWTTNALEPIVKFMRDNNIQKPLMISEGGVAVDNIYGEDLTWFAIPRLRNMYYSAIMKYPQIKLINYFNVDRPTEKERFYISGKDYAINILNEAASSGAYLRSFGSAPDFTFTKANDAGTLKAKNGIVNLYTLACVPGLVTMNINYTLDGVWYHSTEWAPYKCGLNIQGLSDGSHTLAISSGNLSASYTFYKVGNSIRFGAQPDVSMETVAEEMVNVVVNGTALNFDTPPQIINDRTMVPLRAIFEALGAEVLWDEETQTVTSTKGENTISLTIGQDTLYVNGKPTALDTPAMIINDRTMVPVRAVSEAFESNVKWDESSMTVYIEG